MEEALVKKLLTASSDACLEVRLEYHASGFKLSAAEPLVLMSSKPHRGTDPLDLCRATRMTLGPGRSGEGC